MPDSIKGQVSIMLNRKIIESVKFFQAAPPEFLSVISCKLNPQFCINNDYIVKADEVADKMYFIQTGYIEVLCKNEIETLIYYGKGSYFGEVGVLITGKRTLSVKSKSDSIVYYIMKDDLLTILDVFPQQMEFLKMVANQRLSTTRFDNLSKSDNNNAANTSFATAKSSQKLV